MIGKMMARLSPNELRGFLATKTFRYLSARAQARFENEGDDVTGPWAELAFMTGRIRQWHGFQPFHPINVRTGALRHHILNSFRIMQTGNVATLQMPGNQGNATLRSKIAVAQLGSNGAGSKRYGGPNRSAPARPVLGMNDRDALRIGSDLLEWIQLGMA